MEFCFLEPSSQWVAEKQYGHECHALRNRYQVAANVHDNDNASNQAVFPLLGDKKLVQFAVQYD